MQCYRQRLVTSAISIEETEMSGQLGGNMKALPFTGFATLPLFIIGLGATGAGLLLTKFRARQSDK